MKTRTKPQGEVNAADSTAVKRDLPATDSNPPRLLILHKSIGADASIMTFAHPRTKKGTRYYVCPQSGIYELRKMASSKSPSSWLLQSDEPLIEMAQKDAADSGLGVGTAVAQGYVSKAADVFVATPCDPLFLLLPALEKQSPYHGERADKRILCIDDLLEELFADSKHLKHLMDTPLAKVLENRLAAVCQTVEVDERMYRLDHEKLLQEMLSKAQKMSASGLPPTMEDQFVRRPLEKPAFASALACEPLIENRELNPKEHSDSQGTSTPSSTVDSQKSTETGITTPGSEERESAEFAKIKELQRLRIAYTFILSSYFSIAWEKHLLARMNDKDSPVDFTPLDNHLAEIAKMKEEALAARSITDFTRKRGHEDDEAAAERADKRRKQEEDEKRRKANESRGVRDLKKVDVSGMKKMSAFFKKLPAKV